VSLKERIEQGKTYQAKGWRRCANKTCHRLYETDTQSPLCDDCKRIVREKLAEELLEHGYGYTH
jgi:hypothetical protein